MAFSITGVPVSASLTCPSTTCCSSWPNVGQHRVLAVHDLRQPALEDADHRLLHVAVLVDVAGDGLDARHGNRRHARVAGILRLLARLHVPHGRVGVDFVLVDLAVLVRVDASVL